MNVKKGKHSFSIELKEGEALRQFEIAAGVSHSLFLEGFLGEIKKITMLDDIVLEIHGTEGFLRLDIQKEQLMEILRNDGTNRTSD